MPTSITWPKRGLKTLSRQDKKQGRAGQGKAGQGRAGQGRTHEHVSKVKCTDNRRVNKLCFRRAHCSELCRHSQMI